MNYNNYKAIGILTIITAIHNKDKCVNFLRRYFTYASINLWLKKYNSIKYSLCAL